MDHGQEVASFIASLTVTRVNRDRGFRRFPNERQRSVVSAIGPQIDFECFHRAGERFQIHFRAAEIGGRIVILVELPLSGC